MGSKGVASYNEPTRRPPERKSLPTPFVQGFRKLLSDALKSIEAETGKRLTQCIGAYCFYDYDGEPIYVGQTTENYGTRIGRHLTGQRSDTLAYRILDPFEVAEMVLFPLESARKLPNAEKKAAVDTLEYSVYVSAIEQSRYGAILNEKIPPVSKRMNVLPRSYPFDLVPAALRGDREHPDVRIARRAETLARVAAVAHERGEVSAGLRRVIVIQAVRLADLAAGRLAYVEGRSRPPRDAIDVRELVGNVLAGFDDVDGDETLGEVDLAVATDGVGVEYVFDSTGAEEGNTPEVASRPVDD
jgi:hypothetical protein